MWYKKAQDSSAKAFDHKVKTILRTDPFFKKLFQSYGVNLKDVWRLHFQIANLKDSYCKTRNDLVIIDPKVLANGLKAGMHYLVHEITHWLTRQQEKQQYFSDPEELRGFEWAIAHEFEKGEGLFHIKKTFLPLILPHFKTEQEAIQFLIKRIAEARQLLAKQVG